MMETPKVRELRRLRAHEEIEFLRVAIRTIAYRLTELKPGINANHRTYNDLRLHYVLLTELLSDAILSRHGLSFDEIDLHVFIGDGGNLVRLPGDFRYTRRIPL